LLILLETFIISFYGSVIVGKNKLKERGFEIDMIMDSDIVPP
jgi:hypothetical protein